MKRTTLLTFCSFALAMSSALGQTTQSTHDQAVQNHSMPGVTTARAAAITGPHGGSIKHNGDLQFETIISQAGLRMFVYDRNGDPISIDQVRGAVSVRVEGNAKRYRYGLLPDGKGALTTPVNLSQMAGRQMEVDVQLVGIPAAGGTAIRFNEVATVPASEQQLAAAAIARQKICPVSGKALGSMGDAVAVDVNGQQVFVCCSGCVSAVKSDPARFAVGRPEITVMTVTPADAAAIAAQKVCPVMDEPLGGMGRPIKVMVGEKPIYLCCKGCIKKIQAEPTKYVTMVYGKEAAHTGTATAVPVGTEQIREGIFRVTAADAAFITAQRKCPVMDEALDAMGGPYKVNAAGKAIYICCPGCAKKIAAEPQKYLAVLASQGVDAPVIR